MIFVDDHRQPVVQDKFLVRNIHVGGLCERAPRQHCKNDTLLIDQEAVYAPRQGNDRLLLGLKGSLNEYELDLLRHRSLAARYEKARRIDIAVTTPGLNIRKTILDYTEEDLDRVLTLNIKGTVYFFQVFGRIMMDQGGGSIIACSSVRAVTIEPGLAVYGSTKAAIGLLVKGFASEVGRFGVAPKSRGWRRPSDERRHRGSLAQYRCRIAVADRLGREAREVISWYRFSELNRCRRAALRAAAVFWLRIASKIATCSV